MPGADWTCPHATYGPGGCMHVPDGRKTPVCYVEKLLRGRPHMRAVLVYNTELLKKAQEEPGHVADLVCTEMDRFRRDCSRSGVSDMNYRLHWSGDFFSERYAEEVAEAVRVNPDIMFWTYTRSFFAVPFFAGVENMNLYLSADCQNHGEAIAAYALNAPDNPRLRIALMSAAPDCLGTERVVEMLDRCDATAAGVHATMSLRYAACPVDDGRMPLEHSCHACRLCLKDNPVHIWFRTR